VYFVDHTGANWPVDVSTYTWNQAQGIDSTYVNGSCPGYGGTHCIDLFDADYGATGWVGLTTYNYDGNQNLIDGQVYIQLNDYNGYSLNGAGIRQVTCQEMGHSLGMGHNGATDSCMYGTILNSDSALYPDGDDFSQIADIYSVGH